MKELTILIAIIECVVFGLALLYSISSLFSIISTILDGWKQYGEKVKNTAKWPVIIACILWSIFLYLRIRYL